MPEQLSVGEKIDVMDLMATYARSLEAGDIERYLETFTRDGVFEAAGERYEGREAIGALVSHLIDIGQDGPGGNRHILGLPWITGTADGCAAQTYVIIARVGFSGGDPISSVGQYTDQICMSEGRWRFAHRHIQTIARARHERRSGQLLAGAVAAETEREA